MAVDINPKNTNVQVNSAKNIITITNKTSNKSVLVQPETTKIVQVNSPGPMGPSFGGTLTGSLNISGSANFDGNVLIEGNLKVEGSSSFEGNISSSGGTISGSKYLVSTNITGSSASFDGYYFNDQWGKRNASIYVTDRFGNKGGTYPSSSNSSSNYINIGQKDNASSGIILNASYFSITSSGVFSSSDYFIAPKYYVQDADGVGLSNFFASDNNAGLQLRNTVYNDDQIEFISSPQGQMIRNRSRSFNIVLDQLNTTTSSRFSIWRDFSSPSVVFPGLGADLMFSVDNWGNVTASRGGGGSGGSATDLQNSGNISASGYMFASRFLGEDKKNIGTFSISDNRTTYGTDNTKTKIQGLVTFSQNIQIDGNVSSSGYISASQFIGSFSGSINNAITAATASYVLATNIAQPFTNITASGNISASGTGSFNHYQIPFNRVFTGRKNTFNNNTVNLIRNVGDTVSYFGDPNTSNVTVQGNNIKFDSTNGNIQFKDSGSTKITFDLESTPRVEADDDFEIQSTGDLTFDAQGSNIYFLKGGDKNIEFNTNTGLISSSGDIIANNLYIGEGKIYGNEAYNNYLTFNLSSSLFKIQNKTYIKFDGSSGQKEVTINEGTNNINLVVKGDSNNPLFKTVSNTNQIGTHGQGTPEADFHIGGNLKTNSHITASGNISASGRIEAKSFTGSFSGSIANATSSSFATTSISSSFATTASYAHSASVEITHEVSSSFAQTAATASYVLASNISQPFTHITASGNISASDTVIGNTMVVGTNTAATNIELTVEGDISASGAVYAGVGGIRVDGSQSVASFGSILPNVGLVFGDSTHPTTLQGSLINLNAAVTSSAISSSGYVSASQFIGSFTGSLSGTVESASYAQHSDNFTASIVSASTGMFSPKFSVNNNNYFNSTQIAFSNTGDNLALRAGLSGIGQGEPLMDSVGGFSFMLDSGGAGSGAHFSLYKGGNVPVLGTQIFHIDNSGNITASSNISASGYVSASQFIGSFTGSISGVESSSYATTASYAQHSDNFTASIMTASRFVGAEEYKIAGNSIATLIPAYNTFYFGNPSFKTQVQGTNILLDAPVTASGFVSASGIITDKITAGSTTVGLTITGNVTASGNVSASGNIQSKNLNVTKNITANESLNVKGLTILSGSYGPSNAYGGNSVLTAAEVTGSIFPQVDLPYVGIHELGTKSNPWRKIWVSQQSLEFVSGSSTSGLEADTVTSSFTYADINNLKKGRSLSTASIGTFGSDYARFPYWIHPTVENTYWKLESTRFIFGILGTPVLDINGPSNTTTVSSNTFIANNISASGDIIANSITASVIQNIITTNITASNISASNNVYGKKVWFKDQLQPTAGNDLDDRILYNPEPNRYLAFSLDGADYFRVYNGTMTFGDIDNVTGATFAMDGDFSASGTVYTNKIRTKRAAATDISENLELSALGQAGYIGYIISSSGNALVPKNSMTRLGLGSTKLPAIGSRLDLTGDMIITGSITSSGGNISASGNIISDNAYHKKIYDGTKLTETDTYIEFGASSNHIDFYNANRKQLNLQFSSIRFNDAGNDVDFYVEGTTQQNLFHVDAGNDRIGIGYNTPPSMLAVAGDIHANTHITASGNISASGNILTSANIKATNVSASGNISASGYIATSTDYRLPNSGGSLYTVLKQNGSGIEIGDVDANDNVMTIKFQAGGGNSIFEFGDNVSDKFVFTGEGIHSNNNITTDGNISASGKFIGAEISASTAVGGLTLTGNITASGNISGSATTSNFIAATGSFQKLTGDTTQATALEVEGYVSASYFTGNILYQTGSVSAGAIQGEGDIIYFGNTTTTAGKIYTINPAGEWTESTYQTAATSTGSLAMALGTNSTTHGMLLRGIAKVASDSSSPIGSPLYLFSNGRSNDAVTFSAGEIARIVGYYLKSGGTIFFDPDKTWVVVS